MSKLIAFDRVLGEPSKVLRQALWRVWPPSGRALQIRLLDQTKTRFNGHRQGGFRNTLTSLYRYTWRGILPKGRGHVQYRNCKLAAKQPAGPNVGVRGFGGSVLDRFLRRVSQSQAANLRRKAAEELSCGRAGPFLALVGVSLASGNGLITKQDEIECVCSEIRKASAKVTHQSNPSDPEELNEQPSLQLGSMIAKGCNAVVYAAKWSSRKWNDMSEAFQHIEVGVQTTLGTEEDRIEYPMAVKMMFNYEAESNAATILNAMKREIVPAQNVVIPNEDLASLSNMEWNQHMEKHPNIVDVKVAFADQVPDVSGAMDVFPDALPRRLNPEGFGRNMTLFLVMKRYDCSLKEYLLRQTSLDWKTSLKLLTQLLEGVTHMVDQGVAHRDLKTDNILLDLSGGESNPVLVITDFGCCYVGKRGSLQMAYPTSEISLGGNLALMAPEVVSTRPSPFATVDYSKADVWAVGAIAYEIFGGDNPFYSPSGRQKPKVNKMKYNIEDLPNLDNPKSSDISPVLSNLVHELLEPNPKYRMTPEMSATICQLMLWAPKRWFESEYTPGTSELMQWLVTLTTKLLCESRFANKGKDMVEYQMIATFLARLSIGRMKEAIEWIRHNR